MQEFLNNIMPNIMNKVPEFWLSIWQTLQMFAISGLASFLIGLIIGIIITVTKKGGILQNLTVFHVLDKLINFFRSIPFIILIPSIMPLTRLIVGTGIGVKGAVIPLIIGAVPFFARQIESSLAEIDSGLIEAAQSMGSGPLGIIFRVYLRESVASISRATTITAISLIGLISMAGAVGAGGIGDFAIRYGHQRRQLDVTYVSVIVLVLFISIVQAIGSVIEKKTTH